MEAIWNRVRLERPPTAICYVRREKFNVAAFLKVLETAIKDLNSQELMHKEAAILSRLIYRMKSKFRNDKGVKAMFKVNKALLIYLSLSLEKEYENLQSCIEQEGNYIKLPTKQMIEYVLVRTQGFAKLMLRIEEVSKHSAHFLKSRIALGHAWGISVIAYAVISRIWILSRHLIKKSCTWYNDVYRYLKFFKASGLNWLPDNYELTSNLEAWLAVPWIHDPTPSVPSSYGLKNTIFKLIIPCENDSDEDLASDIHDYNNETRIEKISAHAQEENIYNAMPKDANRNIVSNDDTGEIIDRYSFNLAHTKRKSIAFDDDNYKNVQIVTKEVTKVKRTKTKEPGSNVEGESFEVKLDQELLKFDNIKYKSDLTALLNKGSYPGLDKLQWNMIRNKSRKLLKKLDACQDEKKQLVLFKSVIKHVQRWIT